MESKEKRRMGREEAADRICQIANMIRNGEVQIGGMSVKLADDLEVEVELEERTHEGELEIEIEWRR